MKTGMIAVLMIGSGITLGNLSQRYGEIKKAEQARTEWAIWQEEKTLTALKAAAESGEESTLAAQAEETNADNSEKEGQPNTHEASARKLNLAFYYPEDAKSEDIIDSYAGQVFQELMIMDLDWLADLYELSDISPSTMASRLGKSTKSIMGGYNPRDKKHKPNMPSSWVIHDWKKIHVNFVDGDGHAIEGFSNVKDILSMASVYTYYTDMMDVDTFAEYSRQLWKNSHSYSLSMGDLYYCSGCLNKTEEELVREAEEKEFASMGKAGKSEKQGDPETSQALSEGYIERQGVGGYVQGDQAESRSETASEMMPEHRKEQTEHREKQTDPGEEQISVQEDKLTTGQTDETADVSSDVERKVGEQEKENVLADSQATEAGDGQPTDNYTAEGTKENVEENEPDRMSMGNINQETGLVGGSGSPADSGLAQKGQGANGVSGLSGTLFASSSEAENVQGNSSMQGIHGNFSAVQNLQEMASGQEQALEQESSADHSTDKTDQKKQAKKTSYDCPGHVDLYIRVKILGLKDKNGLFSIAKAAEQELWEGWTKRNIASVQSISSQDWFDNYGLSVSSISLSTPLTNQEIEEYMNQLPEDTSVTRRNIVHFALSSVGRVPYYWGGKASAPGYEGNHFGALIPADDKGRMLRGLDCSGWINWVYWSATGKRLPGESTSSLCLCGEQISRRELQPGDIIVRTGAGAHVVMFLSWSADGRMNVIHESSASINNVSVTTMDAPWPYYRKLVP